MSRLKLLIESQSINFLIKTYGLKNKIEIRFFPPGRLLELTRKTKKKKKKKQTDLLTKSPPDESDLFSLDDTGDVYFSQIFFSS